jgi:GntR family transcriptional regulator, sialic acid-inducible nan operon repressor
MRTQRKLLAAAETAAANGLTGPIQRRKLYQEVLDRLLARIRAGEFPQGGQLPSERQLMQAYAVGRPAVREALLMLQRMGLISITHGDRARVVTVSADTAIRQVSEMGRFLLETSPGSLDHLKDARLFFEVGMVRIAAQKATVHDIARLRAALDEHRAALKDGPRFLEKDLAFHRTIASISGNPIFEAVSRAMLEWLERYHEVLVRAPGREPVGFAEHTRIFNCIAKHDADGAARAMTAHLTRANKLYVSLARRDSAERERDE